MKNLLIVTDNHPRDIEKYLKSHLIIKLNDDGTFLVLKNRHGKSKVGKLNELLNLEEPPDVNN